MNEPQLEVMRRSLTLAEWISVLSLLCSVGAVVFTGGFVYGQVQSNTREIDRLKPKVDDMIIRLERIDANVGFLAEQARQR